MGGYNILKNLLNFLLINNHNPIPSHGGFFKANSDFQQVVSALSVRRRVWWQCGRGPCVVKTQFGEDMVRKYLQ